MKKILIVENEEALLSVLKGVFEAESWDVVIAKDGVEAVDQIKRIKFNLVLLDLFVPNKNGLEVLKEVRDNMEFKDLPVIILSNPGKDEDIKKSLELGANDYHVKTQHPISELLDKAEKYSSKDIEKLK